MTAWVVRAGLHGEREQWALDHGVAGGGFLEVGDLTSADTRTKIRAAVDATFPNSKPGRLANFAGQLLAMRSTIQPGDVIVMPMKTSKRIAVGVCTGGYRYRSEFPDPSSRHTISVDWKTTDVARSAIKDDLLNTLGGAMTIFQASRNNAEVRIRAVMDTGADPGTTGLNIRPASSNSAGTHSSGAPTSEGDDQIGDVTDPQAAPTLEAIRVRIRSYLEQNFGGHKLASLIADILRARGFTCEVSPPGPDGGVDILAGRGPLGVESPRLVVEVKSEPTAVSEPVVRGLKGAAGDNGAEQGLLVAWGGINKQAKNSLRNNWFNIRVWDSEDVLDQLFDVYDKLPGETRALLPLTQAWVLADDAE